ncbi:MAG: hypothetical protein ACREPR_18095 [Brasilonema sp.]
MFEKSNLLLALATGSRGYTDKTHLRGFKTLNSSLVRAGGLRLCSSELYETVGELKEGETKHPTVMAEEL